MTDQDSQNLAKAKTAVMSLLEALEVAQIIYVDDANDENISIESVIAAAIGLDPKSLLKSFPELGDPIPDDEDVLKKKIRDIWGQLDHRVQLERAKVVLAQRDDGGETGDVAYVSILRDLIPEAKLISLSPSQWDQQKEHHLRNSMDQRMLFLFDQDLSNRGGSSIEGIKIIASLLARESTENLICGLLTHTVTPETQPQQWDNLSEEHGIPKDRFTVIPKQYLSKDPILFAQTLKFTALSPDFSRLKEKTKEIIAEAAKAAADRVEKVNIYDFDHIVFHISAEEGLWEPDMLFRLHAMFHRSESRQRAYDSGALEEIAAKLRAVSGIPTPDHLRTPDSAWALQREELYEFGDYINKNLLPLDLGDIFERTEGNSTKKYILLAQPCDLMVRSDGKRYPDLRWIPLLEMASSDKASPYSEKASPYSEEILYFDESPSKKWFVNLKRVHFVSACLLDLCTFNQDGAAKLTMPEDPPSRIRHAWKARHKILSSYLERSVEMLAALDSSSDVTKQTKQQIKKCLQHLLFGDLFRVDFSSADGFSSVTCNCKRISRLSRTRAMGLLMSYTATLGRPAYDRTFGRT